MTHPEDLSIDWNRHPDGRTTDFLITRGKALYRLPPWQRWLMPWRWFRIWRKPTAPFPDQDPYMANVTLLMHFDGSDELTSFVDQPHPGDQP